MPTLLEISEGILVLEEMLLAGDGVLTEEQDAQLTTILESLEEKADDYVALIRTMELRAMAREAAKEGLEKLIATDRKSAEALRMRLKLTMEKLGRTKLETKRFRVSIQGNGGKVPMEIYDETVIPAAFMVPQPDKIDNQAIRQAIEAGEDVPGAKLGERGTSLRIK